MRETDDIRSTIPQNQTSAAIKDEVWLLKVAWIQTHCINMLISTRSSVLNLLTLFCIQLRAQANSNTVGGVGTSNIELDELFDSYILGLNRIVFIMLCPAPPLSPGAWLRSGPRPL